MQVGRRGRVVSDVAAELGADRHAVNDAVMAYGTALLDADTDRIGAVEALGVDEVLFSTPANPTGTYSPPSHPAETRRAEKVHALVGIHTATFSMTVGTLFAQGDVYAEGTSGVVQIVVDHALDED